MGSGKLEGGAGRKSPRGCRGRLAGEEAAERRGGVGGWMELMDGRQACESGRVGTERKSRTHGRFAGEVAAVLKAEFLPGACWCNPITPAPTV